MFDLLSRLLFGVLVWAAVLSPVASRFRPLFGRMSVTAFTWQLSTNTTKFR